MHVIHGCLILVLLLAGCVGETDVPSPGGQDSSARDATRTDTELRHDTAPADVGLMLDAISCNPGHFYACAGPNAYLRCTSSGTSAERVDCGEGMCSPSHDGMP